MMLEYRKRIKRIDLCRERNKLFVFGDNVGRSGFGGQAKELRGERNAVGIPTKMYPSMKPSAFFSNRDAGTFMKEAAPDFHRLLSFRGVIVWPEDGIGTGLAQLERRAPLIWSIIESLRKELETTDAR